MWIRSSGRNSLHSFAFARLVYSTVGFIVAELGPRQRYTRCQVLPYFIYFSFPFSAFLSILLFNIYG